MKKFITNRILKEIPELKLLIPILAFTTGCNCPVNENLFLANQVDLKALSAWVQNKAFGGPGGIPEITTKRRIFLGDVKTARGIIEMRGFEIKIKGGIEESIKKITTLGYLDGI